LGSKGTKVQSPWLQGRAGFNRRFNLPKKVQ